VTETIFAKIDAGLRSGQIIPYLGSGVLSGAINKNSGEAIPADSESLILAMNDGKPMAPKLMYEFARAAMNQELKRGRSFITRFLTTLYGETEWTRATAHDWIKSIAPSYVIDINRDTQVQQSYSDKPHTLITGIARIGGTDYRFRIFHYDGKQYKEVDQEQVDTSLPVLFKPMGTPLPEPTYIASDADYVDYITELMGGFAIPRFIKEYRKGKQYVLLGMRLTRDTERMVLTDIIYDAANPIGWALIPNATDKEKRFCERIGIEVVDADIEALIAYAGKTATTDVDMTRQSSLVGC